MKRAPEPPVDVRATMRDGRVLPVECVYVGVINGLDTWEVAYPLLGRPTLTMELLPAMTAVVLNGQWRQAASP